MPLYEYQCEACGRRFEVIQKFSDPPVEACRSCGGSPVQRLPSSPAIQFKGTGWYITDYSQKGKAPGDAAGGDKADKGDKKDASGDTKDTASSGSDKEKKSASSSESSSGASDSASKPPTPTTT